MNELRNDSMNISFNSFAGTVFISPQSGFQSSSRQCAYRFVKLRSPGASRIAAIWELYLPIAIMALSGLCPLSSSYAGYPSKVLRSSPYAIPRNFGYYLSRVRISIVASMAGLSWKEAGS